MVVTHSAHDNDLKNQNSKTTDMKNLIALILLITITVSAQAQMPYNFTYKSETYTPLTNGIALSDTNAWDESIYAIPLGYKFQLGNRMVDTIFLNSFSLISQDTSTQVMDGLVFIDADLQDRGALDSSNSKSPISYEISGTKGDRICKIEIANAGFYAERDLYNTMDDYVNIQLWIYEADSKFEMRYGPSQITNPTDYFVSQTGPIVGYADYFNSDESSGIVYLLSGDYDSPTLDSFSFSISGYTLSSYPKEGTVYTFTPKKTLGIDRNKVLQDVQIYPTAVRDNLHINLGENTDAEYRIISATGQTTNLYGTMDNRSNMLDLSHLPSGMYILQLSSNGVGGAYRFTKI